MDAYDIIHFEALGPEANHLKEEILIAQREGKLPTDHKYLITPASIQDYLVQSPAAILPDIVSIKTHSVLSESYLKERKRSIITRSAGYDHVEHLAATANITSLRDYCINAVAQTAMKFLYAAAGELNHYTRNAAAFERNNSNAFMELNKNRTATVFGVGRIGKRVHELLEANGLTVRGVDVRQEELVGLYEGTVQFVSRNDAITSSDIIINAMNLTRDKTSRYYNAGYFSDEYLSRAPKPLIFINVTRGEMAPESVLYGLYQAGRIAGIGLDVFTDEAQFARLLKGEEVGGEDLMAAKMMVGMSRDRTANIYVQPHQAFNSDVAAKTKAVEAIKHVIAWYKNSRRCFDEQLPYY